MGINLGAFLAPLVVRISGPAGRAGTLGFGAAGVGMTLGVVQYVLGGRHLGTAGLDRRRRPSRPRRAAALAPAARRCWGGVALAVARARRASRSARASLTDHRRRRWPTAVGYLLLIGTVVFFALAVPRIERGRRRSAGACTSIGVFFLAAALFWSVFEQAGSTLNLFADRSTRNELCGLRRSRAAGSSRSTRSSSSCSRRCSRGCG